MITACSVIYFLKSMLEVTLYRLKDWQPLICGIGYTNLRFTIYFLWPFHCNGVMIW